MKRILVNRAPTQTLPTQTLPTSASACSGCRACEVACVARHEGRFGTATARIHVVKVEPLGIDQPHVCRQCGSSVACAPCVAACPVGALSKDERTGAVLVDVDPASPSACIGCSACVDACPFGMAALHPETGTAIICDLCGGDPACVLRCATGAIVYAEGDAGAKATREALTNLRTESRQETGFFGKNRVSVRPSCQDPASTAREDAVHV